jgi:hypothetical protein
MKRIYGLVLVLMFGFGAVLETKASATAEPSNAELLKQMQALAAKVDQLEKKLARYEKGAVPAPAEGPSKVLSESASESKDSVSEGTGSGSLAVQDLPASKTPLFGLGYRSNATLSIGAYGELKFGGQEAPGGWKDGFDAGRIVLLPTFQITDNIIFNAEIEFEHGGIAVDNDDKLTGSVDIEQAYVDFKFNEHLNWRAPGIDVVPFGFINLFHEPTQFYSVQRPELDNGQVNTGLEDIGQNGGVPNGSYDAGISGIEALGLSRSPIGDFNQTKNAPGFALRLSYTPPFVPGLAGSTSVFYTSNVTPRGAHSDTGDSLGHSSVTMVDTELRYRVPNTGFEFRGEFVDVELGSPENLRANNDGDPENNVGDHMWGGSLEAAYHIDLKKVIRNGWELVPFYRYTYEDLQTGGFSGSDANFPTGQGRRQFHTIGLAAFPTPQIVLKLDYQFALDDAPHSPRSDHLLGAVGFFF